MPFTREEPTAVFSLQEAEYLDAEELARFSLTNSIFLQHMRFLAIILAVIGVDLYAHGLRVWPYSLWIGTVLLLWGRLFHWKWLAKRRFRNYKPAKEWPIDIATVSDTDGHVSEYRMRSSGYTVKHLK